MQHFSYLMHVQYFLFLQNRFIGSNMLKLQLVKFSCPLSSHLNFPYSPAAWDLTLPPTLFPSYYTLSFPSLFFFFLHTFFFSFLPCLYNLLLPLISSSFWLYFFSFHFFSPLSSLIFSLSPISLFLLAYLSTLRSQISSYFNMLSL